MEIAAAISLASSAFNALKKGMETGREIEDMVDYFGKWFEAKDHYQNKILTQIINPHLRNYFPEIV